MAQQERHGFFPRQDERGSRVLARWVGVGDSSFVALWLYGAWFCHLAGWIGFAWIGEVSGGGGYRLHVITGIIC